LVKGIHRVDNWVYGCFVDATQRARGLAAETTAQFRADDAGDDVIANRVRSQLGRHVSHPRSIAVACRNGCVTLSGPILAHEVDDLMATVSKVRGVTDVENRLAVHKEAGNVSGLHGTGR
jgi:osmotically-inducible protein OsmY